MTDPDIRRSAGVARRDYQAFQGGSSLSPDAALISGSDRFEEIPKGWFDTTFKRFS
jgi:hypothetical protein